MAINFTDFYIVYPGHPNYKSSNLIEDDLVRIIVQKYEMVIFSKPGDVFGDSDFGADLESLLFDTKVDKSYVEGQITRQIEKYISELVGLDYGLEVQFFEDPERFQDYMEVIFQIKDYEVYAVVG
jgi:hypothetical protein